MNREPIFKSKQTSLDSAEKGRILKMEAFFEKYFKTDGLGVTKITLDNLKEYFIDSQNPLVLKIDSKDGKYIKVSKGFIYVVANEGFENEPNGSWQFVNRGGSVKILAVIETRDSDFQYPVVV